MSTPRSFDSTRAGVESRRPAAVRLAIATVAVAVAAWTARRAGGSVVPGGVVDECAHLLTTLLVVWALGRAARERFLVPALIAAVAIDLDHVPDRLGSDWLTAGTSRPYPHSLSTIFSALLLALAWRRRRELLVGVALGVTLHLWWDAAESKAGVPLLWPLSNDSFTLPFGAYVLPMLLVVAVDAYRVSAGVVAQRGGR